MIRFLSALRHGLGNTDKYPGGETADTICRPDEVRTALEHEFRRPTHGAGYIRFEMKQSFKAGDVVSHSRFGVGVIQVEWGNWTDTDERGVRLPVNGAGI